MILRGLEEFREHLGGKLTVTMLAAIGHGIEIHSVQTPLMAESILELRDWHERTTSAAVNSQPPRENKT